jgi:hypothetical protein
LDVEAILKKMRFKEELHGVVLNAPAEIEGALVEAGFSKKIGPGETGFTLLFVRDRAEAEAYFKPTIEAIERDSLLWVAYPKGGSKVKTDINRDSLWKFAEPYGFRPVSQVSIDKTWSALRFRPSDMVKRR